MKEGAVVPGRTTKGFPILLRILLFFCSSPADRMHRATSFLSKKAAKAFALARSLFAAYLYSRATLFLSRVALLPLLRSSARKPQRLSHTMCSLFAAYLYSRATSFLSSVAKLPLLLRLEQAGPISTAEMK
ncbi:hypothetical protein AMTRI_Chr09g20110 [Amborella trichopoda]